MSLSHFPLGSIKTREHVFLSECFPSGADVFRIQEKDENVFTVLPQASGKQREY